MCVRSDKTLSQQHYVAVYTASKQSVESVPVFFRERSGKLRSIFTATLPLVMQKHPTSERGTRCGRREEIAVQGSCAARRTLFARLLRSSSSRRGTAPGAATGARPARRSSARTALGCTPALWRRPNTAARRREGSGSALPTVVRDADRFPPPEEGVQEQNRDENTFVFHGLARA